MHEHPVKLSVEDDLWRSRLTVFFRLILAIPHLIWIVLWTILVAVLAVFGWIVVILIGRLPAGLHRFFCSYIRYSAHFFAYITLAANPYPGFVGDSSYPVDVQLPEPGRLSRWKTLLRLILALPAIFVLYALLGTIVTSTSSKSSNGTRGGAGGQTTTGLATVTAVCGWFAALFTAKMPRGLRDAGAFSVGYRTQVLAYLLLVTDVYPNADPTAMLAGVERPPRHPVHLVGDSDDLRRSRVTVLFRLPLLIPHLVWLVLWTAVAFVAAVIQWFFTLAAGRPIGAFHRFLSRYVRYGFHVYAFGSLTANAFPGFAGAPGIYPLDLVLPPPGPQRRWKTLLRVVLALPAFAIQTALSAALVVDAILMWFAALFTAKAPAGLRNLSAYALRYSGQANAYFFLLTDVYPHSSPLEGADVDDPRWHDGLPDDHVSTGADTVGRRSTFADPPMGSPAPVVPPGGAIDPTGVVHPDDAASATSPGAAVDPTGIVQPADAAPGARPGEAGEPPPPPLPPVDAGPGGEPGEGPTREDSGDAPPAREDRPDEAEST
ncbi:MAG TPA: DUF4389 domain-containing protein [Gaiellaceae bacterium]